MVTRKRIYDPVPTQYSANHTLICLQTVQLHSTTLTLTLDILNLKDGLAATVCHGEHLHQSWIFMTYCLSYERV